MSDDLEQRVAELERRVAQLESQRNPIPRVSKEGLEDFEDEPKIKRVSTEGLDD